MYYVYIIRSQKYKDQIYTGFTEDIFKRIKQHNRGESKHTSKFVPWDLVWYCIFPTKSKAKEFEKYLKSHSGRAFRNKRLV